MLLTVMPKPRPDFGAVLSSSQISSSSGFCSALDGASWLPSVQPKLWASSKYRASACSAVGHFFPLAFHASHFARPVISNIEGRLLPGLAPTVTYLNSPYSYQTIRIQRLLQYGSRNLEPRRRRNAPQRRRIRQIRRCIFKFLRRRHQSPSSRWYIM